jgi:hypothetical protein
LIDSSIHATLQDVQNQESAGRQAVRTGDEHAHDAINDLGPTSNRRAEEKNAAHGLDIRATS